MRVLISLATAAVMVFASACSSVSGPSGPTGSLTVAIKDSPANAKALLVTFSAVNAHSAESGWLPLTFSPSASTRTCDLLRLADAQDILGVGTLVAGHYTQLRLVVASATLYFDNPTDPVANPMPCASSITAPAGSMANLEIPSGDVRLNREFDVLAGGATKILVDFDADRSVVATGNGKYRMTPVIGIVSVE